MAKPVYYLTFLGEPIDRGESGDGLPEGEEIFEHLRNELPRADLEMVEADGCAYAWYLVIRQGQLLYRIELTRPFKAFDRLEWLITTEPMPTLVQRFWKPLERRPFPIHGRIQDLLAAAGKYHSFTTYVAGGKGGADWTTYPA